MKVVGKSRARRGENRVLNGSSCNLLGVTNGKV